MEARLLIVLAAVVLIRLPFLDQPIQGDEVYYLAMARNALVDPLHPMQMGYTFQGSRVSMAGHPHPPLNAWILTGLVRVFDGPLEAAFHAAYVMFSLIAVWGMWILARRFTERRLLATMLFATVPAFLVNGNTLEADLPFLALWMAGFALYIEGKHLLGAGSLALAALAAYQGVFAAPILAHHVWHRRKRSKTAWIAVAAAPAAMAGWQLFEWATTGEAPMTVLAGYIGAYGLARLVKKLHSALALLGHLGWPALPAGALIGMWWQNGLLLLCLAGGVALLTRWAMLLWKRRADEDGFIAAWGLLFFGGAVAVFYAGSARYLLPLAPAVALTLARSGLASWLLWPAAGLNLAIGLTLAAANYDHAEQYRRLAYDLKPLARERRLWFHAEWGLRQYLEEIGGQALERDQPLHPGDVVVRSEMAGPLRLASGGPSREVLRRELTSRWPVRLIGLRTRSGYSSSDLGLLPFEPGRGLLDRVSAEIVGVAEPRLSYLRTNDPGAAAQLLAGFYQLENNAWRWMAEQAVVILKLPRNTTRFEMTFFIPDAAPARRVTVAVDGRVLATHTYGAPGRHTLAAPWTPDAKDVIQAVITVDKSFRPPGDDRTLGIIVQELGLR